MCYDLPMKPKFAVLFLAIIGVAVYANTLPNRMFWDDFDFILNNKYVHDFSFRKFFSQSVISGAGLLDNYWRPLLLTVFSLEYQIWGAWAPGYHIVNMLFHIGSAILLFFILLRLFGSRSLAFFTAAIFTAHPLQTEAVTYVNSLGDSLSVFLMFSGILFHLGGARVLPSVFYALALASKETAIIMPAYLALAEFVHGKDLQIKQRAKQMAKALLPLVGIGAIYLLLRATTLNFQNTFNLYQDENYFTTHFSVRLFTFFKALFGYFGLIFWPANLHMERELAIATSLKSPEVIAGGAVLIGLIVAALAFWRRKPIISFGVFWFLAGLFPVSNLAVPINGLFYEHWLYAPIIGIALLAVWLGSFLADELSLDKLFAGIGIVIIIALGTKAIIRNRDWRDPITLYNNILQYNTKSYRVYNNLGMAYADAKQIDKAKESYERAVALDDKVPVAYHNLGNIYRDERNTDKAIEYYERALDRDKGFIYSANALASLYLNNKDYEKAKQVITEYFPTFYDEKYINALLVQIEKEASESIRR